MLTDRRTFIGALFWLVPLAVSGQDASSTPLKVLFIGNSYTSVNDLPAMVAALAEAADGRKIEVDRHLVGGCTLEKHVKDQKAIDKIRGTKWDVVVLQEQSLRPVIDRQAMHQYAGLLDAEIKQQGAKAVFYLTWARQHIPDMQEGADPAKSPDYAKAMYQVSGAAKPLDFEAWRQQQKAGLVGGLNGAYLDIATELKAGVAPVGIAWKMALAADPPFVLHRPDKSHPNATGTYLAACVFYATLLDANPVGLPGKILHGDKVLADIPDNQAKRLQEIAWAAVKALATISAQAQYQIYWGDMHGHTANSDGKGSLDDYFTYARDVAKLDFVVVSDHDFGNSAPWHMPKEVWTLTQDKADQYTVDGKFVGIAGYEWTSQPKYWTPEEPLFTGPVKYYNHKNVYFPARVEYLFSAKDPAYNSPNLLAQAVQKVSGLIQNNHPDAGTDGRDQFHYDPVYASVIVNTELWPDTMRYQGKTHEMNTEQTVREFLNKGGKTGFVGSTDTHEGKPAAKTAIFARELTRPAIFEALQHRRNYAVFHARIVLDFRIDGHFMGEEIEIDGKPRIAVDVHGTDEIEEVVVVRDGAPIHTVSPGTNNVQFDYVDEAFANNSYYYVQVIQADKDEHGNRSHAWASPIWVKKK